MILLPKSGLQSIVWKVLVESFDSGPSLLSGTACLVI